MKTRILFLAILCLFLIIPASEAQVSCATTGTCLGNAFVEICNQTLGCTGAGGTRVFCLTTRASCALTDGTSWEMDAGSSITVTYRTSTTGLTPPGAPTTVVLDVLFDNSGTVIRTLSTGSPPAAGTSYTFYGTTNGLVGGSPRAGTYRLRVDVSLGGVGAYDGNSDGSDPNENTWSRGAVRSSMSVSALTASTPTGGITFAYGVSGNEQVTLTATHTQPNGDANVETARWRTRTNPAGTVHETQATTDIDATTSTAYASTIDLTYPSGSGTYDADWDLIGNAALTGRTWTKYTSTSTGRISDTTVRISSAFIANPSITFSTDGSLMDNGANTDHTVYNRVETVTYDFWLLNARGQQITRSMTIGVLASDTTVEDSQSKTGAHYAGTYATVASDKATPDDTGDLHSFRATNTDQSQQSSDTFGVSSLYYVDSHSQLYEPLNKDNFPTEDVNEDVQFTISADIVHFYCHVVNVRKDTNIITTGSPVLQQILDPSQTVQDSISHNTDSSGWIETPHLDFPAEAPAGVWTAKCSLTFNGNTGTDSEALGFVSAFTANLRTRWIFDQTPMIGETIHLYLRVEKNNQPKEPDITPTITISYVLNGDTIPPVWTDVVTDQTMMNVEDWTETVNGALYIYNFTIPDLALPNRINPDSEFFNINSLTFISGAGIRHSEILTTLRGAENILTTGLELGTTSTMNVLAIGAFVFLGVMLWARSDDMLLQVLGSTLVWFGSLMALTFRSDWSPMLTLAIVLGLAASYMMIRAFWDTILTRRGGMRG